MLRTVLIVGLASLCCFTLCTAYPGNREELTKSDLNETFAWIVPLIKNNLKTSDKSNELPSFFYKYVCGRKQIVAGYNIDVEFLVCSRQVKDGTCKGVQRKCSANIKYVPYLVHATPSLTYDSKSCKPIDLNDGTDKCSWDYLRPKRSLPNNNFDISYTMEKPYQYNEDIKTLFDQFIIRYKKGYSLDSSKETYFARYQIFKKNLKIVEELNRVEQGTAVYGITEFMDYTEDEYSKYLAPGFTKKLVDIREADLSNLDSSKMPDSFDWREKGAVTNVKNQGQCGSCWAFSTTGNIEGQWFIKKKKLISLSEQELVDCDSLDQGCEGGLPSNAYKSIEKLGGLETESDYPYAGSDDKCDIKKSELRVFINDSIALPKDEDKLAAWLAENGPISIGINANLMQFYFGGISHPWKIFCNPRSLDHGVLIVGYGTENGTPFWIIKNSWGPSWGEKGYYRLYRGDGSCGVNQMATSAIVD